jgi:hypothetical protein
MRVYFPKRTAARCIVLSNKLSSRSYVINLFILQTFQMLNGSIFQPHFSYILMHINMSMYSIFYPTKFVPDI